VRVTFFILLAVFCGVLRANPSGEQALPLIEVCQRIFIATFHHIGKSEASVTTQRRERRVAVHQPDAEIFLKRVEQILGPGRTELRDVPESREDMFITNTDYLRTIVATGSKHEELNRARIRIRNYFVVPQGTTSEALAAMPTSDLRYSKIADGEGVFAKLEFKVGSPDPETQIDIEGVVNKPGITLLRSDIDLLLLSPESFRENREAVLERAKSLTLTKNGIKAFVNNPEETQELFTRIGRLHEQGWQADALHPQSNVRYRRQAYRMFFQIPDDLPGRKFEVQLTFDEDIRQTYLRSGNVDRYDPGDRVIELKIPVEYAGLSDAKLKELGLSELADLRSAYEGLNPLPETERESGKRTNLRRKNRR